MKNKFLGLYWLSAVLLCSCFYSCLQDESFSGYQDCRFFDTDGADEWMCTIAAQLKQKNDSTDFVTGFVREFGYPLWRNAYMFHEGGNVVFAVPIKSIVSDAEIKAIWFFSVASDKTEYRIYTREMVDRLLLEVGGDEIEETWMFDYFTHSALHKRPVSNLIFKEDTVSALTRSMYWVDTIHCVHAYAGVEGAEGDQGVHCWTTTSAYFVNTIYDNGGGGGNGGLDGGFGGGGGGGGGTSPVNPAQIAPKASSIFRNSKMTEQNWKVLENMLDKIMVDCLGGELYNGLKSFLKGKTLTIQFKEGSDGGFGMQGESVGISLGMQMESNQLLHEMFHAYQAYQNTIDQYNGSTLNSEIEAHYAQYLYTSRLKEYRGSKWEKRDNDDIRRKSIKKLAKYVDKKGNLLPGATNDLLDIEILNSVIPALRAAGYSKDKYPLNGNPNGAANFKNLNKLTVNCK